MQKFVFLFIIFLIITSQSYAQNITGKILDVHNEPIAFAHIYFQEQTGTISNDSGYFRLTIPHIRKHLKISAIGYKTKLIHPDSIAGGKLLVVHLSRTAQILNEVVISSTGAPDSAYMIIRKSIESIPYNYSKKKFSYKAFYRETTITDTTYTRISEAIGLVSDHGYRRNISKTDIALLAMRKSADKRKLSWRESLSDWLYKNNGFYRTLGHDRLKIKSETYLREAHENISLDNNVESRFFNSYFLDNTLFEWTNTFLADNKDTVYQIDYYPKDNSSHSKALGTLYISAKDFAIIEFTSYVVYDKAGATRNHLKRGHRQDIEDCQTCSMRKNRVINDSIYFYTHVKYKKKPDNKYYLHFISSKSTTGSNSNVTLYSDFEDHYNSQGRKANLYMLNEIYVLDILPYQKVSRKLVLDRDEDMYDLDPVGTINAADMPMVVPINEMAKKHLSEGKELFSPVNY